MVSTTDFDSVNGCSNQPESAKCRLGVKVSQSPAKASNDKTLYKFESCR